MNVIVVDDEKLSRDFLLKRLKSLDPPLQGTGFMDPKDALGYAKENKIDVAFLDIEMFGLTGLELATLFKEIQPEMRIIFVTGFANYAVDAFALHADGYVLKPASKEALQKELNHIMEDWTPNDGKRVRIQTFGNFEIFVDGQPLKFKRSKSKELFAYLVDRRGASVTSGEMMGILWEDKEQDNSLMRQYQTVVSEMMATLKKEKIVGIIEKSRNSIALITDDVECDYYAFLNGDVRAINSYVGEYMTNYSWAEFTTAVLSERAQEYQGGI